MAALLALGLVTWASACGESKNNAYEHPGQAGSGRAGTAGAQAAGTGGDAGSGDFDEALP